MSDPKKPTGDRMEYTGQTTGHIVVKGELIASVKPGDVLTPTDAHHRKLLEDSGHFVPTTKRTTQNPGPDMLPEGLDVPAPESSEATAEPAKEQNA